RRAGAEPACGPESAASTSTWSPQHMTAISGDAPSRAAAPANRELEALLRGTVEGEVAFDDYTRHLFSRDASMYAIEPAGVVFPRHEGDVQAAVAAAAEAGIPVVPRGAGTSLAGQTVGPGLVLDLS